MDYQESFDLLVQVLVNSSLIYPDKDISEDDDFRTLGIHDDGDMEDIKEAISNSHRKLKGIELDDIINVNNWEYTDMKYVATRMCEIINNE